MRGERQEGARLEQHHVYDAVEPIGARYKNDGHDDKLCVQYEQPGQYGADEPAYVPYAPHHATTALVVEVHLLPERPVLVLHDDVNIKTRVGLGRLLQVRTGQRGRKHVRQMMTVDR